MQDACTKLRGTYYSVINGGIDVTIVNPDNETGVDAQRERMVVAQCCRYKQSIQLVEHL